MHAITKVTAPEFYLLSDRHHSLAQEAIIRMRRMVTRLDTSLDFARLCEAVWKLFVSNNRG